MNAKAPEFSLRDQYDRQFDIRQGEGNIIVLLASDAEGSKQNRAWIDCIEKRYKDTVVIVGIADTRGAPFFIRSAIRNEFKKISDGILLDWNGLVFTLYDLAPKVSNLVLIDKDGVVRYRYAGEATAEACAKMFREIDKLKR